MSAKAGPRMLLPAVVAAALGGGCISEMGVNQQPLGKLLASRLEAQEVTRGTSLGQMCRVYSSSEGMVRRINSGNPILGRGDLILGKGVLYLPRVSCDAILNIKRKYLKVTCSTAVLRVYPVRFGPKATQLRASYFLVDRKLKRKKGEAQYPHLGTRAIYLRGGLVIHGGAPPAEPLQSRYEDQAVKEPGACVQISNKNVEELYDLLEKGATVMLTYD